MLKIKNLTAVIDDNNILDDINLDVNKGEIHAIMGPPRSGKTMLTTRKSRDRLQKRKHHI